MNIFKKVPTLDQIAPVYAVIVVIIYTRSSLLFFWRLPSWLYYSNFGEIFVFFAYMITVTLLESLLVLLIPVLASWILPKTFFYDQFITKGSVLVMLGLGYLLYDYERLVGGFLTPWLLLQKVLVVGLLILGLTFLIGRISFLDKLMLDISNRLIIFLYIWIPVSVISLVTVLIRNIS